MSFKTVDDVDVHYWFVAYILTSQDFSWLQNGHVNCVSRFPVIFFLGGGFRFDFLRPIDTKLLWNKEYCIVRLNRTTNTARYINDYSCFSEHKAF